MSLTSLSSRVTDVETKSVSLSPIYGLFDTPVMPLADALARALKGETELGDLRDILAKYGGDFELNIYTAEMALEHWRKSPDWKTDPLRDDPQGAMAIHCYTQESAVYPLLNQRLRNADRSKLKHAWFPFLRLLLCAALRLPVSETPTLYRGVKLDLHAECTKDSRLTWWAFSSCTNNVEVLQNEMFLGKSGTRTMFAITASGRSIKRYSAMPNEDEQILLPGTVLKVSGTLNMGSSLFTIQLQEQSMNMIADIKKLKEEVGADISHTVHQQQHAEDQHHGNGNIKNNNQHPLVASHSITSTGDRPLDSLSAAEVRACQSGDALKALLVSCHGLHPTVLQLLGSDYTGAAFLRPDFMSTVFSPAAMAQHNINKMTLEPLQHLHDRLQPPKQGELFAAVVAEDYVRVQQLLLAGADANETGTHPRICNSWGNPIDGTPAVYAAVAAVRTNDTEILRLLLEFGGDANALWKERMFTALHAACFTASVEQVRLLVEHGADVNRVVGQTGYYEIHGLTPLLIAAQVDNPNSAEICQILLAHGADGRFVTPHPLDCADQCCCCFTCCCRADANAADIAAHKQHTSTLRALEAGGVVQNRGDGKALTTTQHPAPQPQQMHNNNNNNQQQHPFQPLQQHQQFHQQPQQQQQQQQQQKQKHQQPQQQQQDMACVVQ